MTNDNSSGIYWLKGTIYLKKKLLILFIIVAIVGGGIALIHFSFVDVTYYGKKALCDYCDYTWRWITFTENNNSDRYNKELEKMLNELGNCNGYNLTTRNRNQLMFFQSHGMALVGDYSNENYISQKKFIADNYDFASNADKQFFKYEFDDDSAFEFDINKWHFMLLKENDEVYYIPEYFRIVGFNDTDKKIAFLYYSDQDMDCFGDKNDEADLKDFVDYSFSYNFRK